MMHDSQGQASTEPGPLGPLFQDLPVGVVIHGPDGRILAANPVAEATLGIDLAAMRTLRHGDARWCTVREDGSPIEAAEELPPSRVLATGLPVQDVVLGVVNQGDGRRSWLHVCAAPIALASHPGEQGVCVVFTDVTRMRSRIERLALWGHALEFAELALVMGELAGGRLIGANPQFCAERGLPRDTITTRFFLDLFPPEQAAMVAECFSRLLAAGHVLFTADNRRADGSRFPVSLDITLLRGDDGQPAQWIAHIRDLSRQRRPESGLQYTEDRYRALVEQAMPDAIFIHDHQGRFLEVNRRACDSVGYTKAELLRMTVTDLEPQVDLDVAQAAWLGIGLDVGLTLQGRQRRKDGTTFPVEVRLGLLQELPERLYLGIVRDTSEREKATEYLELAHHVYESSNDAILITDGEGRVIDANRAFARISGYTLAELAGSAEYFEQRFGSAQWIGQELRRSLATDGRWQGELWDRRKDGQAFAKSVLVSALRDGAGRIFRHVVHFSDISERRLREGWLRRQRDTDALTGLPGRLTCTEHLHDELQRASVQNRPVALLCIDLDGFKDLNTSLGVACGDQILREIGLRLRAAVRDGDLVARLGGDEFAVVLRDCGTSELAERIAGGLLRATNSPVQLADQSVAIGASVGGAIFPDDGTDADGLLLAASQALALAKRSGRARLAWCAESRQRLTRDQRQLLGDLAQALPRNELVLHFQPVVDLATGVVVKVEGLLRWRHPLRGLLLAGEFIELAASAEQRELAVAIGEWVGEQAVAMAERLRQRARRTIQVSVNLFDCQLADGAPALHWPYRLRERGLPGSAIAVEIGEALLIQLEDRPLIRQRLRMLRELGVELAIDDFGSGYSSPAAIADNGVGHVKIGRSEYIARIPGNPKAAAVVEAMLAMARKLGVKSVAKGVETARQREWLRAAGCELGQGFLLGRPLAGEAIEALVGDAPDPVDSSETA